VFYISVVALLTCRVGATKKVLYFSQSRCRLVHKEDQRPIFGLDSHRRYIHNVGFLGSNKSQLLRFFCSRNQKEHIPCHVNRGKSQRNPIDRRRQYTRFGVRHGSIGDF